MSYKKFLIVAGMVLSSSQAYAQTCTDTAIERVRTGSTFGTAVRMVDRACGSNGWVCLDGGDLDQTTSNRAYATILTAQSLGADVFVSWDPNTLACEGGNFPVLREVRVDTVTSAP